MATVDDVYAFISAAGLAGGATGWTLVRRRMLDDTGLDQIVVVGEDGGVIPEIPDVSGSLGDAALSDPGVLVSVRAGAWDGDASLAKAEAILAALHGLRNTTVGGVPYLRVRALTPEPIFAGFDDRGRPIHTVAFRLLREQVPSSP